VGNACVAGARSQETTEGISIVITHTPKTKRHAKPSSAQLIARIYRKQLAMEANQSDIGDVVIEVKDGIDEMRSAVAMLSQRMESYRETTKTLTDHCARLLKEKETLQRQVERLRAPTRMLSHTRVMPPTIQCAFVSTHVDGVPCGVCGYGGGAPSPSIEAEALVWQWPDRTL
jgi:hypothetical protein